MSADGRERLFEVTLEALCREPEAAIEPERLLAEAGMSDAGFRAEFGDVEGLMSALAMHLGDTLVEATSRTCAAEEPWPARVAEGLGAVLRQLAERPDLARVTVRSLPGRSRAAGDRYQETLNRFAAMLTGGRSLAPEVLLPDEVEMLAVGAAEAIIVDEILAGRAAKLPAMSGEILYSVLVPFLGPEAAWAEARRPS